MDKHQGFDIDYEDDDEVTDDHVDAVAHSDHSKVAKVIPPLRKSHDDKAVR